MTEVHMDVKGELLCH